MNIKYFDLLNKRVTFMNGDEKMKVKYYDLENKRVFITGGGSGIGASIVEHFCEQGSEVYFIDINEDESKKLIEDIKNKNHNCQLLLNVIF